MPPQGTYLQPCDSVSTDRIYIGHWDTLCFNKTEMDCCQHVRVRLLLQAGVGVGWESQQAGSWLSFCLLQPGVCFVLKGLLLLTVLMCTGKAGQWRSRVTDSSHRAAGRKGTFLCMRW